MKKSLSVSPSASSGQALYERETEVIGKTGGWGIINKHFRLINSRQE